MVTSPGGRSGTVSIAFRCVGVLAAATALSFVIAPATISQAAPAAPVAHAAQPVDFVVPLAPAGHPRPDRGGDRDDPDVVGLDHGRPEPQAVPVPDGGPGPSCETEPAHHDDRREHHSDRREARRRFHIRPDQEVVRRDRHSAQRGARLSDLREHRVQSGRDRCRHNSVRRRVPARELLGVHEPGGDQSGLPRAAETRGRQDHHHQRARSRRTG